MIQLLSQPGDITFTRNPMVYRWRGLDGSGELYRPFGVRSELRGSAYDGPDVGETITIDWTEPDGTTGSVTFTAVASPSAIDEIPAALVSGYPDWPSYYTGVGDAMKAHPLVGPLFQFYNEDNGSGQSFWIEALELDDDWSVTFDITGIVSPNFSVIDTATVTATTEPDNYRLIWELMLETTYLSGGYSKVATGEVFMDADGEFFADLSKVMDSEVRNSLSTPPIPDYSNTDIISADIVRRYYIRYREAYDGIVSPSWTNGSLKKVMCGGVSRSVFASMDFLGTLDADNSLLTWLPDARTVSTSQREYLAWYNYTGTTQTIILQYAGYLPDGSLTPDGRTFFHTASPVTVQADEVYLIPVGLEQMGVVATDVYSYRVRVVDEKSDYLVSPVYVSQERTYYVDRSHQESERQIMYLNGFCCPETLRCTGYVTHDLEVARDEAERILEPGYTDTVREQYQYDESWQPFFTFRTGFISRLHMHALQELLIYNQAYEIHQEAYIPLLIKDTSFRITETRNGLHAQTFTATPALLHKNYSNVLMVDASQQADLWLNTTSGYWLTIFGQRWAQL